jgi:hypothetical protein
MLLKHAMNFKMAARTVANLLPEINLRTRQSSPYEHGNILFAAPATTDPIYDQTCGTLRGHWSSFVPLYL